MSLAVGVFALSPAAAPAAVTPLDATDERPFAILAVPAPPVITVAPPALTNVPAPTFGWTGDATGYQWSLVDSAGTRVDGGTGPETTVTLSARLADGSYTFSVFAESTDPLSPPSDPATHTFALDTVAPPTPRITTRPPFPTTVTTPEFGVADVEPGAAASWSVVAAGGVLAQGPAPLGSPTVTLGALTVGSYLFQVVQTDPAGNASPTAAAPFAIVAPPAAPAPKPAARAARLVLPKMNTHRLTPRVGASIRTVRPVLTWSRGPRGTTVYNVQVFRVGARGASENATVRLTKLRSVFPRARQVRMRGLARGQCYVWRVWPFIGTKFTAKPLGVSNFCVAKKAPRRTRGTR